MPLIRVASVTFDPSIPTTLSSLSSSFIAVYAHAGSTAATARRPLVPLRVPLRADLVRPSERPVLLVLVLLMMVLALVLLLVLLLLVHEQLIHALRVS